MAPLATVLVTLLALTLPAHSADLPAGYTCADVQKAVRDYGKLRALALALSKGATRSQIRAAKRCMEEKQ